MAVAGNSCRFAANSSKGQPAMGGFCRGEREGHFPPSVSDLSPTDLNRTLSVPDRSPITAPLFKPEPSLLSVAEQVRRPIPHACP